MRPACLQRETAEEVSSERAQATHFAAPLASNEKRVAMMARMRKETSEGPKRNATLRAAGAAVPPASCITASDDLHIMPMLQSLL